jgi:osmotically-inducible protein OsmY
MGADYETITVTLIGRKVRLAGTAPSYTAKARAAETLRDAGYTDVDNSLRVVPGLSVPQ